MKNVLSASSQADLDYIASRWDRWRRTRNRLACAVLALAVLATVATFVLGWFLVSMLLVMACIQVSWVERRLKGTEQGYMAGTIDGAVSVWHALNPDADPDDPAAREVAAIRARWAAR